MVHIYQLYSPFSAKLTTVITLFSQTRLKPGGRHIHRGYLLRWVIPQGITSQVVYTSGYTSQGCIYPGYPLRAVYTRVNLSGVLNLRVYLSGVLNLRVYLSGGVYTRVTSQVGLYAGYLSGGLYLGMPLGWVIPGYASRCILRCVPCG